MIDFIEHSWTGYTKNSMTVSDSSHWSSHYGWTVFDGSLTQPPAGYWLTNGIATGWIKLDFGTYKKVLQVSIQVNTIPEAARAPKDFTIQGSNDDSSWDTLKTVTGETSWGSGEKRDFTLTTSDNYRYYKVDITANNGSVYTQIGELYLYGDAGWTGKINGIINPSKIMGVSIADISKVNGI